MQSERGRTNSGCVQKRGLGHFSLNITMENFGLKLTQAVQLKLLDLQQKYCTGCQDNLANQLGHSCLFQSSQECFEAYFSEAFDLLDTRKLKDFLYKCLEAEFHQSWNTSKKSKLDGASDEDDDSGDSSKEETNDIIKDRFYYSIQHILDLFEPSDAEQDDNDYDFDNEKIDEEDQDVIIVEDVDNECSRDTVIIID